MSGGVRGLVLSAGALVALSLLFGSACKEQPRGPDLGIFNPCTPADLGSQSNRDCPNEEAPLCHPSAKVCVGCIPSMQTCLPGYTCEESTFKCVPLDPNAPCKRQVDCPKRLPGENPLAIICDFEMGICRECVEDGNCVAPDRCIDFRCQVPDGFMPQDM